MREALLASVLVAISTAQAGAFCFQGSGVSGALDYLVCLHNEQNKTINSLADTLNSNADVANSNYRTQATALADLERKIRNLELEIAALRSELSSK